jgi:glyoxylate reductase
MQKLVQETSMKPKVLLTRELLPKGMDYLRSHVDYEIAGSGPEVTKQEILAGIRDKEGLISLLTETIDREIMDAAPLKIIANCAVGYNNIDVSYAKSKGILVTNTPGILTDTTADLTLALILATARSIPRADLYTRKGRYKGWALDLFLGREITDKCLGIVGMGRIGRAVAQRARAFRMEIIYTDTSRLPDKEERELGAAFSSLEDLLKKSDIVTLHTTLTEETHHLISAERIALMKKTALLVNVSRGPVVDEKALMKALARKHIWGAGLDVYEREPEIERGLMELENVVLLPHIGSATEETRLKMSMMAAENLVAALQGKQPPNLI